jgi:enoyl-CoA hydratase
VTAPVLTSSIDPSGAAFRTNVDALELLTADLRSELAGAALETAQAICANSRFAIRMTKQIMWANLDAPSLDHALELENRTQILATMTRDSPEAMRAFVEKRPAEFTGE